MSDLEKIQKFLLNNCPPMDFFRRACFLFSTEAPTGVEIHSVPRLNILLSGAGTFKLFENKCFKTVRLEAPAIYYCAATGYQWMIRNEPGETISFCYFPEYLRVVYFNGGETQSPANKEVYHTREALSPGGMKLIQAIESIHSEGHSEMIPGFLANLFFLSVDTLRRGKSSCKSKIDMKWQLINKYLRTQRERYVSRQELADMFHISPSTVSRIIKRNSGTDLAAVQSDYRLAHAVELMTRADSNFSIDEIADKCGFHYRTYFYRLFKDKFGETPRQYLNNLRHYNDGLHGADPDVSQK